MRNKFITTAIYYPNGKPHLGYTYELILADAISRYHKVWIGQETFFLTGADEHGQKIADKAKSEGKSEQQLVDEFADVYKDFENRLGVNYDRFVRTTDPDHAEVCKNLWLKILDNGDLYEKEYSGLYCVGCESFKTEKDLNENGECPDHLKKPIELKEKNWFFRLSKYQDFLKEKIESDELKIIPESKKKEILSFINSGLEDISFSRSKGILKWGITVPNDETQVMYVWCDALTNYITGAKAFSDEKNFQDFWTDGETLHVVGKDILRFHACFWPAMLHSAGLAIPKEILVHGHILTGGQKMSKSLGNVIDPQDVLNVYSDLGKEKSILCADFGREVLRYFMLKNISPFDDGDFTYERLKDLYNADLANGLGNLVSRVMKLSEKYLDIKDDFSQVDLKKQHSDFYEAMSNYDVMTAMNIIWQLVKNADTYMQSNEPFKVIKVDEVKGKEMLENLRGMVYTIALLLNPFMPTSSEVIKKIVKENKMPEKSLFPRYE